jgi:hypothetical protein
MLNVKLARAAFRSHAEALVVVTTGAVSLSATATGYARAAGSFVTDGFVVGMELTGAGFGTAANNTPGVVTAVTATDLTIDGGRTAEAADVARALTVGWPAIRAYELVGGIATDPRRWWVDESFAPGAGILNAIPGDGGLTKDMGIAEYHLYGIAGTGDDALDLVADELLRQFRPTTILTLADGSKARVLGKPTPYRSASRRVSQWGVVTVAIPYAAWTRNVA